RLRGLHAARLRGSRRRLFRAGGSMKMAASTALGAWAGATEVQRDAITSVLDVTMEIADDEAGPLLVAARDILDAAADGDLGASKSEEQEVAATDLPPSKVVSLLSLVIEFVPESDAEIVGALLEQLVARWTREERRAVADWAVAVHVHASDNPGVSIPPRPAM